MFLLAGLGNPGSKYAGTRHNIGFMMLDYLASKYNLTFVDSKYQARQVKTVLWHASMILLKPETYMNLSGNAVSAMANFFKIENSNIVVVHDDLDLELGRIRISAGHSWTRCRADRSSTSTRDVCVSRRPPCSLNWPKTPP